MLQLSLNTNPMHEFMESECDTPEEDFWNGIEIVWADIKDRAAYQHITAQYDRMQEYFSNPRRDKYGR